VQRLLAPLLKSRLDQARTALEAPSGSGTERIAQYES